jgi:polyhydroxybutyrate depolymerase
MKIISIFLLIQFSYAAKCQLACDSILIEGRFRSFYFNKPTVKSSIKNLLFLMHGSGGSGDKMMGATKNLEALSTAENLLLVYPNGYKNYWNECRKFATSDANKENINEEAFFTAMIQYFKVKYGIDEKKVFAAGFSGGGHMAYKLAITLPSKIKAIAAIVANLPDVTSCDCKLSGKAKSVLIINGTDDNVNPDNGGEMFVNNVSYGVVKSTQKTFEYWASLAGYKNRPIQESLPDRDTTDHKTIESYTYKKKHKPTIKLLKVMGGKHEYPNDIDVFVYVWNFLKGSN